jgi:hypothetical protein
LAKAVDANLLTTFRGISPLQTLGVYADDVMLFIHPAEGDLQTIKTLLDVLVKHLDCT